MKSTIARTSALLLLAVLFASAPVSGAAEPALYGSLTTYGGSGKHPKSGTSGLIIDARTSGVKFICYSYSIRTNSRVKGQVSGTAERISDSGIEILATFGRMSVRRFPIGEPPPSNDPCAPDIPDVEIDFNLGVASECVQVTTPLDPDDIIRWRLDFKKGAALKGRASVISLFGSVIPLAALPPGTLSERQVARWMRGRGLDLLLEP